MSLAIEPIDAFQARLRPPGSKSLTNRAMLLAVLADGRSVLRDPLFADDTRHMLAALQQLGFDLTVASDRLNVLGGAGQRPVGSASSDVALHLGNAGTAMRTLTAACCQWPGRFQLDGEPRMRQRPIGELVDPLRRLGAQIEYLAQSGYPPLAIQGGQLAGGTVVLGPTQSSQFVTALLMIGPGCRDGLTIQFDGPITSRPYVEMTLGLMARFGIRAQVDGDLSAVTVQAGGYQATDYQIEPDASSAGYFLAAAAIVPGSKCTIEGLGRASLQGDVAFADVLHQMGADLMFGADFITVMAPPAGVFLRGLDCDLNGIPDMALTAAVVALFCHGPSTLRNIGNLRLKETDRLSALQNELTKLGARVEIDGDDLHIEPPPDRRLQPAAIDTYNDHRMAMSFSVAALAARTGQIVINDPDCVSKTFPDFFKYLDQLRQKV